MTTIKMKTLLYTIEGETIKVLIEGDGTSKQVVVKGYVTSSNTAGYVKYSEPSFIFSEPCFLKSPSGDILTEYRLVNEEFKGGILNLASMNNMTVMDDFANNQGFKQVHLPTSVKVINKSGFLESIEIISGANAINYIGDDAFNAEVRGIDTITFSNLKGNNKIISIGKNAFYGTTVNLPLSSEGILTMNSFTNVGESAFESSKGLKVLEAKSLTTISKNAFKNSEFSELTLSSAIYFEDGAFTNIPLDNITLGNITEQNGYYTETYKLDIDDISDLTIYVPSQEARNFLISQASTKPMFVDKNDNPITMDNILIGAWYNTTGHTAAEVVEALDNVSGGAYTGLIDSKYLYDKNSSVITAFNSNTSIQEVNITSNKIDDSYKSRINSLKKGAIFKNLSLGVYLESSSIQYLNLASVNAKTAVSTLVSDMTEKICINNVSNLTALTLPATLKVIDTGAFAKLSKLTTLSIPNSVTQIENKAFENCSALEHIYLPTSVDTLSDEIFSGCSNLEFEFTPKIKNLGASFLKGNTKLESLTIPSTVTSISPNAFDTMKLKNITFERFDLVEFSGVIIKDCPDLKAIYLNTGADVNVSSAIFNKCNVYINNDKNYELLIENTVNDTLPVYILGDWYDVEGCEDIDFDNIKKLRDVSSIMYNDKHPVTNYQGDELYLVNPLKGEFDNIDKVTTLTKLTIKSTALDLDNLKLPTSLKHLEISENVSNVNISGLTNLTYLGLNNSQDYGKSLSSLNNLKILKTNGTFTQVELNKPLELVVFSDSFTAVENCLVVSGYEDTSRKNYNEINPTTTSKLLDLERRSNTSMDVTGLAVGNINYISPIITPTELFIFNSEYLNYDLNRPGLEIVYTHNLSSGVFNFSKQTGESFNLSSSIKYLKLDNNLTYTADPEDYADTTNVERDTIIIPSGQTSLNFILRTTTAKNIYLSNITELKTLDLKLVDNLYRLDEVENINWGIYGGDSSSGIHIEAPKLLDMNYTYPDPIPSGMLTTTTTLARYVEIIAPKLSSLEYTTSTNPTMILEMSLKHLEVGNISDFNLIDKAKDLGAITSLSDLEYAKFGPAVKTFGDNTFEGASSLEEIYIESDELTITSPSTGVNPNVKVYVSDEQLYENLHDNPTQFITTLKSENVILFSNLFNTFENPSLEDLITVYSTGMLNDTAYVGINDENKNLYDATLIGPMNSNLKILYIYTNESDNPTENTSLKELMDKLDLRNVTSLKIIGNDAAVYNVGEDSSTGTLRASSIMSVDLSKAKLLGNTINNNAFKNCSSLSRVSINDTAKIIGESAFDGCSILEDINCIDGGETTYFTEFADAEDILRNFKTPDYESYTTLDDSQGKLLTMSVNFAELSQQYSKLIIKVTSSNLSKLSNLPESLKTLELYGSVTNLSIQLKNISELIVATDSKLAIPSNAFKNLKIVKISGNIGTIGENAFDGCNFTSINLPSVTSVGNGAFNNNMLLTSVTLMGLTSKTGAIFEYCDKLETVSVSCDISSTMFKNCANIKKVITLGENIEASAFKNTSLEIITASNVKTVGNSAFYNTLITGFSGLNCTSLGVSAFENCGELVAVNIAPCSIPNACFKGCIKFNGISPISGTIGEFAFANNGITTIDITDVTTILDSAFENSSLREVHGTDSLVTISQSAFKNCTDLKCFFSGIDNEFILNNATSIGSYAFENTNVKVFTAPNVLSIGVNIFNNCTETLTVDLSGVTTFETVDSEWYFENLTFDTLKLGTVALTKDTFTNLVHITNFETHTSTISALAEISKMLIGLENFTAPELTTVPGNAFINNTTIKTVNLAKVTELKYSAFEKCTSLTTVTTPLCKIVGNNCFLKCPLNSFTAENCTSVGNSAFEGSQITSYELSSLCNHFGTSAFKDCTKLTIAKIYSVTVISESAFSNCSSITSIDNLENVTEIGNYAFNNTTALKTVTMPTPVTEPYPTIKIGKESFLKSGIETIVNQNSISSVGSGAFMYTAITEFKNNIITTLPNYTFGYCNNLTTVELSACVNNECNFINCPLLANVTYLNLDLVTNIACYDERNYIINVLSNFTVPGAISTKTTFRGTVNYYNDAENVDAAKQLMENATFVEHERETSP